MKQGLSSHTIVIALTAFGLSGDREKCINAGMDDYLAKPVRMEQLKELLNRWRRRNDAAPAERIRCSLRWRDHQIQSFFVPCVQRSTGHTLINATGPRDAAEKFPSWRLGRAGGAKKMR